MEAKRALAQASGDSNEWKVQGRKPLTREQLRDCATLDRWLTEHGVLHKTIADRFKCTEGVISHHRNGRLAINKEWMMNYAIFFDVPPQELFPTSWARHTRDASVIPCDVSPSLAKLQPIWNKLTRTQRKRFVAMLRRAVKRE